MFATAFSALPDLSTIVLTVALFAGATPVPAGSAQSSHSPHVVEGHTRMPDASTVAVSLRLVGIIMNVNVVDAAVPEYAAAKEAGGPEETDVASEVNVPVEDTLALAGVTLNVTGTVTDEPETSVSPVANVPKATVVASTAAEIAGAVRLLV